MLTVVFLYGVVNAHFFVHPHLVDGVFVFHSHPYKKQATGDKGIPVSHQHSANGYLLVQALDKATPDLPSEAPGIGLPSRGVAVAFVPAVVSLTLPTFTGVSLWRAPPMC